MMKSIRFVDFQRFRNCLQKGGISPKETDFKHKEFRIKEKSGYISYKKGTFLAKRNTLPLKIQAKKSLTKG